MIRDCQAVVDRLVKWLQEKVAEAGASTAVVGVSGGVDSALVAALCKRAFPDTALGVIMPCHSSPGSTARGQEVCKAFGLRSIIVDLSLAHNMIRGRFEESFANMGADFTPKKTDDGALRSCLRAPTLDFASKLVNGIIVGTGNRDEDGLVRYFQKRGDGCVDVSPIADLHKSEVYQLLRFLDGPGSVLDAPPTADLWGPDAGQTDADEMGMTYDEIEWADREDRKYGVLTGTEAQTTPIDLTTRFGYTTRQMDVITKVRHMERTSRHKAAPPPVCEVRKYLPEQFE